METELVISFRCQNTKQRDFLTLMLSDDANRPLFEEDVNPELRKWFHALEDVDSADWVSAGKGYTVHAGWFPGCEFEETLMEIDSCLRKADVEEMRAVVAGDEGWYMLWLQQNGTLKEYSSLQGMELDELFDGVDDLAVVLDTL